MSKYTSTKRMESDGQTAGTKGPKEPKQSKEALLDSKRANLRANIVAAYVANKDAPELPGPAKKKAMNDILKRNMEIKKPQTAKEKPSVGTMGKPAGEAVKNGPNYTIAPAKRGSGIFDAGASQGGAANLNLTAPQAPKPKPPSIRDTMKDDIKEYLAKPNPKKLKELKDRCAALNINFDQMHNKAKEDMMKEKTKPKEAKPTKESSMENKLAKRIANGNKLIEELQAAANPAPYNDSILQAAKYSKLRILEAFISYYSDDQGLRENKINETDLATGRSALHYLAYMGNNNLIQLLGATDGMKMNILDAYDRTCMHYAAIKGGSTTINTIFLLFKSHGGAFHRAELDPNAVEEAKTVAKTDVDVINDEIQKEEEDAGAKSVKDEADNDFDMSGDEEDKSRLNIKTNENEEGGPEVEQAQDPVEDDEEQKEEAEEEKPLSATEFGQSEQAFEIKAVREMDRSDRHHIDGKAFEPLERDADDLEKGGHAQTSMRSLLNFRDHKGRTALHIAAIWNNKAACETLLYLKANPLIEDGAGYRPVDYVDSSSAIADLLKNFMARATPPNLAPFGENDVSTRSGTGLKLKMMSATQGKKAGPGGTSLELPDLKSLSVEVLQTSRIGETQDNYFQAAVKAKKLESAIYLKTEIKGFPLAYQNGIGNTVLHNAITIQDIMLVKLVLIEKFETSHLDNPASINDIKGNFKQSIIKCLLSQNAKGWTPLSCAIESGGTQIFKLILELYHHLENRNPASKVLSKALAMRDSSGLGETPLIKAIRKDRYDMFDLLLQINKEKILKYDEVLCATDSLGRNILHHAVIKQATSLVKKIIILDADHRQLRNGKDSKSKTPQLLDDSSLYKDVFETVWDAAKAGNVERLKQLIKLNDDDNKQFEVNVQTTWLGNTPLHIAVKNKQLKAIKVLIWELKADNKIENNAGFSPKDYCNKFIKDEATRATAMGLLTKMHQNTQVVKNIEAKREKARAREHAYQETQRLRLSLRKAIETRGYDIAKMFKVFDSDGSGTFDQTEFEAAFTVLELDFKVSELRKLIELSDKNNDGVIDFNEFHSMLYAPEPVEDDDDGFEVMEDSDDN